MNPSCCQTCARASAAAPSSPLRRVSALAERLTPPTGEGRGGNRRAPRDAVSGGWRGWETQRANSTRTPPQQPPPFCKRRPVRRAPAWRHCAKRTGAENVRLPGGGNQRRQSARVRAREKESGYLPPSSSSSSSSSSVFSGRFQLGAVQRENEEVQHQEGAGRVEGGVLLHAVRPSGATGEPSGSGDSPVRAFPALQGGGPALGLTAVRLCCLV